MEVIKIKYKKDKITEQIEEIERCFKCSACSIFCPATLNVSKYDIENAFISQIFSGEEAESLKDVWMCCACEKCILVCPQDAEPTEVFNSLKKLSYQKGLAPAGVYAITKQVINTGLAYDISAKINADRKKIALKELSSNDTVSKELKIIAEKTGLKMEAN